jgi:hypothetical protein
MTKATIKNIIICILVVACSALAIRVWFGSFSLRGIFGGDVAAQAAYPWHEAAAAPIVSSARLELGGFGVNQVLYNNLDRQQAWVLARAAIGQLIEGGEFVRLGAADSLIYEDFLRLNAPIGRLTIQYNFPMPSNFFREFFGTRPGFLSSHFEDFNALTITSAGGSAQDAQGENYLEFFFINDESFFVFNLNAPALYAGFNELFVDMAHEDIYTQDIVMTDLIGNLSLAGVRNYIGFLFPGSMANDTINGIWTYWDSRRVVRFFPDNTVEFNAMHSPNASGDFIRALIAAFTVIGQDPRMNEVIFADFSHNPADGRYNFYFDYIVNHSPVVIQDFIPNFRGHALEIGVIGSEVVFYRRLMLNFEVY